MINDAVCRVHCTRRLLLVSIEIIDYSCLVFAIDISLEQNKSLHVSLRKMIAASVLPAATMTTRPIGG